MDSEKTILVRLKMTVNQLDRFMNEVKAKIDKKTGETKNISPIQARILMYLHSKGKMGSAFQKDIETRFDIRSSTAAIILGRMEKNGLVIRKIDSADVRKKTVHLTRKAREFHPQAKAELDNAERQITKGLTRKELDAFVDVLDKIAKNIS